MATPASSRCPLSRTASASSLRGEREGGRMPVRTVPGTDVSYALVVFDETGNERAEADGSQLSGTIAARVADPARPVTDVFLIAHGWQGDVPAAIVQFDRWIGAMAAV